MNEMNDMPKKNPLSMQLNLKKFEPATDEEKRQQDVMGKSSTFFRDGMRKLVRNAPDEYVVLSEPLYVNEIGVAFEKNTHEEMAAELTAVLKEMTADGTAAAILERYDLDAESALGGIN